MVDPPAIDYMEYLADNANPALNKEGQSPTTQDKGEKRDEKPPIGVTMRYDCLESKEIPYSFFVKLAEFDFFIFIYENDNT